MAQAPWCEVRSRPLRRVRGMDAAGNGGSADRWCRDSRRRSRTDRVSRDLRRPVAGVRIGRADGTRPDQGQAMTAGNLTTLRDVLTLRRRALIDRLATDTTGGNL